MSTVNSWVSYLLNLNNRGKNEPVGMVGALSIRQ